MAEKTIISNYKKYPYYLFARCAYAELCLKVGKIKDAAKAINNVYNLKQMYPERSMFHYTEVITLNAFCTKYYCELGDSEQAEIHFKMIKDIDDEHPIIAQLENYIFASFLKKLVQKH
jgi:tetratricopeptide (TPR) repeat protein